MSERPSPLWRPRWPRTLNGILALALAIGLGVASLSGPGIAQILPGGGGSDSATASLPRKHWWDLDRARRCGRRWCSDVATPFMVSTTGLEKMTLAVEASPENPGQDLAAEVENRSTLVATSLKELSSRLAKEASAQPAITTGNVLDWVSRRHKPLHPNTPNVEIGVKNKNKVLYVPADPERKLQQQTLVTLTNPDAMANGVEMDVLASQWKRILRTTLSESLWGTSFDQRYPFGRAAGTLVVLGLGGLGGLLISKLLHRLRQTHRQARRDLLRLIEEDRDSPMAALDGPAEPVSEEQLLLVNQARERERHRLKRRQLRLDFLMKFLSIVRIAIAVMALVIALSLFSQTRLAASFLMYQSASLPLIWIGVILLESLLNWGVMRRLNNWALDAQITDPTSLRPQLRLETNSRVLQGSISLGCILLGIYLTVLVFGIDPKVLAGAGVLAVGIGFLARSLLEDLISGALILSADRYAIGDMLRVGPHSGLVEGMNLAYTRLRGGDGELITIPNGTIKVTENLSKDWSRVNFEVDIAWESDLSAATALLVKVADGMRQEPDWKDMILEPPLLLGVDRIDHTGLRLKMWIKTQPLKQWSVGREFRRRVKLAFDAAGIAPGIPQRRLHQG